MLPDAQEADATQVTIPERGGAEGLDHAGTNVLIVELEMLRPGFGALCVGADTAVPTVAPANVYLYQNQTLQSLGLLSDFAALAKCQ